MDNPYSPPSVSVETQHTQRYRGEHGLIRGIAAVCAFPLFLMLLQVVSWVVFDLLPGTRIEANMTSIGLYAIQVALSASLFIAGLQLLKRRKRAIYFFMPFIAGVLYSAFQHAAEVSIVWLCVSIASMGYAIFLAHRGRLR
jgi:hypothetical protein